MLPSTIKHTFLCQTQIISAKKTFSASVMSAEKYTKEALGPNNVVAPSIRNRNPMNLEKMRIGYKPSGFPADKGSRNYWNALTLSCGGKHTQATLTHWTGRTVCSASTREWAIAKFLYSNTDVAAVTAVGKVLGQRCLETGIYHVKLLIDEKELEKDKMRTFIDTIKGTGLNLREGNQFQPNDPFRNLKFSKFKTHIKPWEVVDMNK